MATMQVSRADIESFTEILGGLTAPAAPKALLSAIVTAISEAIGDEDQPVTVTVERDPSIREQFETAFAPEELTAAGGAGSGVTVKVMKIGR